jgi:hypothetical protein
LDLGCSRLGTAEDQKAVEKALEVAEAVCVAPDCSHAEVAAALQRGGMPEVHKVQFERQLQRQQAAAHAAMVSVLPPLPNVSNPTASNFQPTNYVSPVNNVLNTPTFQTWSGASNPAPVYQSPLTHYQNPITPTQNTPTQNTATQNTATQNTAIQNTAIQNTAIQNTAIQNTATTNAAEPLLGTKRSTFRRHAAALIRDTPDHPLKKFLLNEAGIFHSQKGLTDHATLCDRPDLVQMMHVSSKFSGDPEFIALGTAFNNQWYNATAESKGVSVTIPVIVIGGIAVHKQSAEDWVLAGWLDAELVSSAPVFNVFPMDGDNGSNDDDDEGEDE